MGMGASRVDCTATSSSRGRVLTKLPARLLLVAVQVVPRFHDVHGETT
jgi:hypothetical protein